MPAKIKVEGLREFQASLKAMDAALPKQLRLGLNGVADIVIGYARPRIPTKSGAAAGSLKARSTQRSAGIAAGGRRAAYFPWLDFGGQGRTKGRPPARPFLRGGRYIYPALEARHAEIIDAMGKVLTTIAHDAGLDVT